MDKAHSKMEKTDEGKEESKEVFTPSFEEVKSVINKSQTEFNTKKRKISEDRQLVSKKTDNKKVKKNKDKESVSSNRSINEFFKKN